MVHLCTVSSSKKQAEEKAIGQLQQHHALLPSGEYVNGICLGDRSLLAAAITLVESRSERHHSIAREIIRGCLPHSSRSIRIGITGVPGVGKSTFIDAFGTFLTGVGKKVAVLAIDPSSPVTGGSILGDKTRMERLSHDPHAFIRPSPAGGSMGGVARTTRETMILCEAAGFDVILVETVGVGQSEITVEGMTDFFLLLALAGAGDQLQGIKRGIMEMADAVLITKADGDNEKPAMLAKAEYMGALHLFPPPESGWVPPVLTISALRGKGIVECWEQIERHERWMKERALFLSKRRQQDLQWMHESIRQQALDAFYSDEVQQIKIHELERRVLAGEASPFELIL